MRRVTPKETLLCVGRDRLLVMDIIINGKTYEAIVDSGATASYLPRDGRVINENRPCLQPTKTVSRLVKGEIRNEEGSEAWLSMTIAGVDEMEPVVGNFLTLSEQSKILDRDLLIGIPEWWALDVEVKRVGDGLCIVKDGKIVGRECLIGSRACALIDNEPIDEFEKEISIMIRCFQDQFSEKAKTTIKCAPVAVKLTSDKPIKRKQARFNPRSMDALKTLIDRWKSDRIIESSTSKFTCSAHFVPKKSGDLRLVINYMPINVRAELDNYPLPAYSDMLACLHGMEYFSSLDLSEGYLQIPLRSEDRHKLAFVTPLGTYQFTRLPYGFVNAPSAFQRVMNEIFWNGLYKRCIVYIDDILVFGRTPLEHHENLEWVLRRCRNFNVKLNIRKCNLFKTEVEFLGYSVSAKGIAPCENKFARAFERKPETAAEMATLLGKLGFYSRFIENFSEITIPLRRIVSAKVFSWSDDCSKAIEMLRENLVRAEAQYVPAEDETKVVTVSSHQGSLEVTVTNEKGDKLIGRASQLLDETQSRYTQVEKALMAMALAYKHHKLLLSPAKVVFKTSAKQLKQTIALTDHPPRVERLLLRLPPEANYDIIYEPIHEKSIWPNMIEPEKGMKAGGPSKELEKDYEAVFYTDGSCKENGKPNGRAAWAYISAIPGGPCASGLIRDERPTNQIAEVRAAIEAIKRARKDGKRSVLIYTDSEYVAEAINGRLHNWVERDWAGCDGKMVVNKDILAELFETITGIRVKACKLLGHSGVPGNELADARAKQELVGLISERSEPPETEMQQIIDRIAKGEATNYEYEQGKLWLLVKDRIGTVSRKLYVPKTQRNILLYVAHDTEEFGGHLGVKKTLGKLHNFYWPKMSSDVATYVSSCDICQRFREERGPKRGFMHVLPVQKAFQRVYMDLIEPIHASLNHNRIIVTLVDGFTRFGIAKAYVRVLKEDVIDFIRDEVVLRYGLVDEIVCDNGAVFDSYAFRDAMAKLGIKINFVCPYNPQANGRVERWNGSLKAILRKYTDKEQFEWDKHLLKSVFVYNNSHHRSTGYAPYQLLYGRTCRSPLTIGEPQAIEFEDFDPNRLLARQNALENMNEAALKAKWYYDRKHRPVDFTEGQEIMIRLHSIPLRLSRKLAHKYYGPFKLVKLIGGKEEPKAALFMDDKGRLQRTSFGNIKPYTRRDDEQVKELQMIAERYETEGIPALVRDIQSETGNNETNGAVEEAEESAHSDDQRVATPTVNECITDNLYEERPIPTQLTLPPRPYRRFGPPPIVRSPCRPLILQRNRPKTMTQPEMTTVAENDRAQQQIVSESQPTVTDRGIPVNFDPMDMLSSIESYDSIDADQP